MRISEDQVVQELAEFNEISYEEELEWIKTIIHRALTDEKDCLHGFILKHFKGAEPTPGDWVRTVARLNRKNWGLSKKDKCLAALAFHMILRKRCFEKAYA